MKFLRYLNEAKLKTIYHGDNHKSVKLKEMFNDGYLIETIANFFEVDSRTIKRRIKSLGLKKRKRNEVY